LNVNTKKITSQIRKEK